MGIDKQRMWLAFLTAPLLPGLLLSITLNARDGAVTGAIFLGSVVFCHLPSLLFGLPLVLYLESRKKLYMSNLILPGACVGILVFHLFLAYVVDFYGGADHTYTYRFSWFSWLAGGGLGIVITILFSVIAGYPAARMFDRPDRK